jgi:argininosuccinate lyase
VSDRDFVVEHLADLALIAVHLSRWAEEMVIWSNPELGLVQLDEAYTTGSSIMPQKRNPDMAELIRGKTGRVFGALIALLTVLKGQPLAYNKDLQEDKEALFDAVDTIQAGLGIAAEMVSGLRVNKARASELASAHFTLATDYADYLVRKGIPFRDAHRVIGELVRHCEESGRELQDLTIEELHAASPAFDRDVLGLDASAAAAARDVPGGTAPNRVRLAHAAASTRLEQVKSEAERVRNGLPVMEHLLTAPIS